MRSITVPSRTTMKTWRVISMAVLTAAALSACNRGVAKADAHEQLADTMIANKAFPAAAQQLGAATELDSNEPRRFLKLGRVWRELHNPALSAIAYQRALELDPANVEALQNLAVLNVQAGRFNDAKQYVEPLLVLAPDDLGGLLAQGAIAFYERRYGDADRLATQIIAAAPDFSDGYILRAKVMEARGDSVRAAALLDQRMQLDPDNKSLAEQLLAVYRSTGNLAGIRRAALLLAKLDPGDITYQMEAARAHHAAGREDEARAIHAALLRKYPGSPGLNDAVAEYWLATLPRDQAIDRIAGMARATGGRAKAVLTARLVDLGQAGIAAPLLAADARGPVDGGNIDLQATYAAALFALDRFDDAGKQAEKVLAYDENDTAMLVRAKLAFRKGDTAGALTSAQVVRGNDPDNEEAALLIPKLYEADGNLTLARKAFGDARASMPDSLNIVRAQAAWLIAHKFPEDAASVAAQFTRANPRSGEGREFARVICSQVKTPECLRAANNTRHPWNL